MELPINLYHEYPEESFRHSWYTNSVSILEGERARALKVVPAVEGILDSSLKVQLVIVGWGYLLAAAHVAEITPVFNILKQYLKLKYLRKTYLFYCIFF